MRGLCIILLMFVLTGCATVFTGRYTTIRFDSMPQGARIVVDGVNKGLTPKDVRVLKGTARYVLIHKTGYYDEQIELEQALNPVVFINNIVAVFWFIDLTTGSAFKYNKNNYNISLPKK